MDEDLELKAMQITYSAIKGLDDDAKKRLIDWLIGKFSLGVKKEIAQNFVSNDLRTENYNDIHEILSRSVQIAEIFGQLEPKTDSEKVLIVAAFLQENQGLAELTSRQINDELKHLGHGVSNITTSIGMLINKRPNMMIQTRKEGKSQQAQKKYKVTAEGFKMVMEMFKSKM